MEHIRVELKPFPPSIRGFTVYTFDEGEDYYCMVLNSNLSDELLVEAYEHEIKHINRRDFDSMYTADEIEAMCRVS